MGHDHGGMDGRGASRPVSDASAWGGVGEPYSERRREQLERHHRRTHWCWWMVILLGLWTITAPRTFGYGLDPTPPGREVSLGAHGRPVSE